MSVTEQRDTLNLIKPNAWLQQTPPWCFHLSKQHVTSMCQGLSSLALWGSKMRDPGNEVDSVPGYECSNKVAAYTYKVNNNKL